MDSREYQQLMYKLLGTRDYDNFENNELDCLKSKVGYALFGEPLQEDGYDKNQNETIEKIFNIILKENDNFSKHENRIVISFVYNCTEPTENLTEKCALLENAKTNIQPFPVFILRKCKFSPKPCRIVVDHTGRVYQSWAEYLSRNTLHKCRMIVPKNGKYTADKHGRVILETFPSPACTVRAKILKKTDLASTGIGLASAGIAIAASIPAITIVGPAALCGAGMAGLGVGIYSMGRNLGTLYDKNRHKESIKITNSAARAAYINVIAGTMSFVGAGTNVAISQLASRGLTIGKPASVLMTTIGAANIGSSGLAVISSGYDVLQPLLTEKKAPSLLTLVQLSSSLLFFGHAVHNFKTTEVIIEETQKKILRDIEKTLNCNRHRKAFENLRLEAIQKSGGNVQKGNAEIIATIRKFTNREQLLDILNSKQEFEKFGVFTNKFNGAVNFHGIQVDLGKVVGCFSTEALGFFSIARSAASEAFTTPLNISDVKDSLRSVFEIFALNSSGVSKLSNYFLGLTGSLGSVSTPIVYVLKKFVREYVIQDDNVLIALDVLFPNANEKCLQIINSIAGFMYERAKKLDTIFNSPDSAERENYENLFNEAKERKLDSIERLKFFMEFICRNYENNGNMSEECFNGLKKYFANFLTEHAFMIKEKSERKENRMKIERKVERIKCPRCFGLRYAKI